jgi:protein subunit release factor B
MISADKQAQLQALMEETGVTEDDLVEKFIRGTGHGGQKINKTSSTVYLKHIPTGIEIKCQAGRSQAMNRHIARLELCGQIIERRRQASLARKRTRARVRKLNRRPSKAQTQRRLDSKRRRTERKDSRRPPTSND